MPRTSSGGSRADIVSSSLRSDILAGRFEPGRRLTFPELCAAYGVSVGVLREALVRLVDRGIVRTESNLGFSVMTLSEPDLAGLTAVRAHIEPDFVREAVLAGSTQWEAEVVAAHHLLERAPAGHSGAISDDWMAAHAAFHLSLVSGAGNRRMMEMISRLRDEADLYRRWYSDRQQAESGSDRAAREHRELLEAALSRDANWAGALLRRHIEGAAQAWIASADARRAEPA